MGLSYYTLGEVNSKAPNAFFLTSKQGSSQAWESYRRERNPFKKCEQHRSRASFAVGLPGSTASTPFPHHQSDSTTHEHWQSHDHLSLELLSCIWCELLALLLPGAIPEGQSALDCLWAFVLQRNVSGILLVGCFQSSVSPPAAFQTLLYDIALAP